MTRAATTVPLAQTTTWFSGSTPNRSNSLYWGGTIPWISAATLKRTRIHDSDQHLTEVGVRAGSKLAPAGATLVLVRGMALHRETRIGMATHAVSFNQDVKALMPKPGLLPDFLVYSLQARSPQILALVSSAGSGTGVLNTQLLKRLPIWVPEEGIQREIVAAIDSAEGVVEALERLIVKKQAIKQGMLQQLLTGKTRLPGFSAQWPWREFGDVTLRLNAKKHQIQASAYQSAGRIPVVDQGRMPIVGYTNETRAEFRPGPEGVVVFGDHTCVTKFVDFGFAVGADGTQIVKAKAGNSTQFLSYALAADPVVSTGYNRHFKFLREKVLPAPSLSEQEAIVGLLTDADAAISALRLRLDKARSVKQGVMQQLLSGRSQAPVLEGAS